MMHGSITAFLGAVGVVMVTACSDGAIGGSSNGQEMGEAPLFDGRDPTRPMSGVESEQDLARFGCPPLTDGQAPMRLLCTGLYRDERMITVGQAVRAYEPALTLFSDDARKSRWIRLPAGERIDTTNMDEWVFPVGTKVWKQFVLAGRKIETRFMWKVAASKWVKAVYRWSDDERDAVRLDEGARISIGTEHAGDASYEIPAAARCDSCHAGKDDRVLGFEAVGLGLAGAVGVTLQSLVTESLLTRPPPAASLALPDDKTGQARAALGWMHANCGLSCHTGKTALAGGMTLRLGYDELHREDGSPPMVERLAAVRTTVGVTATLPVVTGLMRIAPGHASESAIPKLAGRRDAQNPFGQMPPGLSHVVDEAGVAALRSWIDAL